MKKDRNCGAVPYPIYPPYQGMPMNMPQGMMQGGIGPVSPMPMAGINNPNANFQGYQTQPTTIEQQLSSFNNQIASLEKRVSNLETLVGNKYNSSNFQVM